MSNMNQSNSDVVNNQRNLQIGKKTRVIQVREDDEVYKVKSLPRGYMLVINNNEWDNNVHPTREGSKQIVEQLEQLGPKFGYKVTSVHDPDKEQFEKSVLAFSEAEALKNVDSVIIIIMSHGDQPKQTGHYYSSTVDIMTKNNLTVSSEWVIDQFSSSNCQALAGKPKIIFFCTGRGKNEDHGMMVQKDGGHKAFPKISDLLLIYPFQPGYMSTKNKIGSYFMQKFIKELQDNGDSKDLYTLLNLVGTAAKEEYKTDNFFEVVDIQMTGFLKKFFFNKLSPEEEIKFARYKPIPIIYNS